MSKLYQKSFQEFQVSTKFGFFFSNIGSFVSELGFKENNRETYQKQVLFSKGFLKAK